MPGSATGQSLGAGVDPGKEQRHEALRHVAAEELIQSVNDLANVGRGNRQGPQVRAGLHRQQGGTDAMAADVGNHDAQAAVTQADVVVEVAAGVVGRLQARRDVEARQPGRRRGKDVLLDLPGKAEFFVGERQQLLGLEPRLTLRHRAEVDFALPQFLFGLVAARRLPPHLARPPAEPAQSQQPQQAMAQRIAAHVLQHQLAKGLHRHRNADSTADVADAIALLGVAFQARFFDQQRPQDAEIRAALQVCQSLHFLRSSLARLQRLAFPGIGSIRRSDGLQTRDMASRAGRRGFPLENMPADAGRVDQRQRAPGRVDVAVGQSAEVLAGLGPLGDPGIDTALLGQPAAIPQVFVQSDPGPATRQVAGRPILLVPRESQRDGHGHGPGDRHAPGIGA